MNSNLNLLMISSKTSDEETIHRLLEQEWGCGYKLVSVPHLSNALESLSQATIDAVLLDLGTASSPNWEVILRLRQAFPCVPILVLLDSEDNEHGPRSIQCGAQDYLLKNHMAGKRLPHAIENAIVRQRQLSSYTEEARTDPLTGALNRRAFEEQCAAEIQRARRYGQNISCIVFDLDRFKEINDTYGHSVGDAVLQAVAEILLNNGRQSDVVCRYGGDEFCVALPDSTETEAARWAERIQEKVRKLRISTVQSELKLTITAGVAQCEIDIRQPHELVDLADQALLAGKHAGRDTVKRYSSLVDCGRLTDVVDGHRILGNVQASDVMNSPIVCLEQDTTMREAADLFLRLRINSAPVVDSHGALQGIISEKDLLRSSLAKQRWNTSVKAVMTVNVISYDVHTPAVQIWEFLSRVTVRRVVIIDEDESPVGVISRGSLLRWIGNWGGVFEKRRDLEKEATSSPIESFSRSTQAVEQEIRKLTRDLTQLDSYEVVASVVHSATRIQEHIQDLLAYSQITYQFNPGLVIASWSEPASGE